MTTRSAETIQVSPDPTRAFSANPEPFADDTGRQNMTQLIQLRWIAVIGQLTTIAAVHFAMHIPLPLAELLWAPAALVFVNLISPYIVRLRNRIRSGELLSALLLDVAALTWQLHLTGDAQNPFTSLYLLQIVLGVTLLPSRLSWLPATAALTGFLSLVASGDALNIPATLGLTSDHLYALGNAISFTLTALLIVVFTSRINRNLQIQTARILDYRRRAAEEQHVVRMGLLASGAAHELSTPLSSIAVMLNDWSRNERVTGDPDLRADIQTMEAEIARCKAIIDSVLLTAGEARGAAPVISSLRDFLTNTVSEWRARHPEATPHYDDELRDDMLIVADPLLKQAIFNVLDNAAEASARSVFLRSTIEAGELVLEVKDAGPGFPPETLRRLGEPYISTKAHSGRGLGLFLVANVMRKLGGGIECVNLDHGGARVTLTMALAALATTDTHG